MAKPIYLYMPAQRGLFVEVYFPKKVDLQGRIFDALKDGYNENAVKKNLKENVHSLLKELGDYPTDIFNPYRYGALEKPKKIESAITKAVKRIDMYKTPFHGWSMYEVDGVFFNKRGRVYEERTQVVRIIFRFKSNYTRRAENAGYEDVLRSIAFFIMRERGQVTGEDPWGKQSQKRFMETHEPWVDLKKKRVAERYFAKIAQEVRKWIEDCALFTYGYLVREFSEKVLETGRLEEEIWVTNFFNVTVNVIQKSK